jgi:hypothetical protein
MLVYNYNINAYTKQILFSDNNDTLLFDGENGNLSGYKLGKTGCRIVVSAAKCATGNTLIPTVVMGGCDEFDTVWVVKENQTLKEGDVLYGGSGVSVCKDGWAKIDVILTKDDGTTASFSMTLSGQSLMNLTDIYQFCREMRSKQTIPQDKVQVKEGKIFVNLGKNIQQVFDDLGRMGLDIGRTLNDLVHDFKVMTFNTSRTITSHNNTQFSIEIKADGNDTMDVIKVYEGSVNVQLVAPEAPKDKQKAVEQAGEDLKNGKITMQEFAKIMKDFTGEQKDLNEQSKPVTVTEGNKCIATKNTIKVEPIESGDEHWWENLK